MSGQAAPDALGSLFVAEGSSSHYNDGFAASQQVALPDWLSAVVDNYSTDPSQEPQPYKSLMRSSTRSVPNLRADQSSHSLDDPDTPLLPYLDPDNTADSIAVLHLEDEPIPRRTSATSVNSDGAGYPATSAIPRTMPRTANTLPPNPELYFQAVQNHPIPNPGMNHQDGLQRSFTRYHEAHVPRASTGVGAIYPRNYTNAPQPLNDRPPDVMRPQDPRFAYNAPRQPAWTQAQAPSGPPITGNYNPYYAAASDVLGMRTGSAAIPESGYSASHGSLAVTTQYSIGSSQSTPYVGSPAPQPSRQAVSPISPDDASLAPRPSLQRSGTSASVRLRTQKSKAIDLSCPPFTKQYIDDYRQRIKGDPDPEAHFQYAKYLIEAAKKVGGDAKDQRTIKRYRDLLIAESLKVIRRLATQGQPFDDAQFFLANCYGTGALGLQVDHERAYHLYLQAAKQNHAAATYRIAVCNEIGAGTKRDPPRAAVFYRKAASLGDTPAMYKLGMILLNGLLGETRNPREGINWLKRAAEQADDENPHALHELGLLHEQPNSSLVVHDQAYAKELYSQAARLGYVPSQYRLGQCFEYGSLTCPVDPRRSIAWYTKAAEKGDSEAELALSGWYLTGSEGVLKQSDSEAYLWARRAANKGLSKAEYAVGYYAEVGIGIKQDLEFAKRWYMRAAAQGNKRAMNRLTELKRMGNKRTGNVARPTRQQAKDECVIC